MDRLFIESFANEQSPYFISSENSDLDGTLQKYRSRLMWHINHSLSPRQKDVLKHYLTGKKESDIARALGVKQQVVNIYKQRAIKKLHRILIK
ncbi:MAG TPA: LuxR C-terminal-related transcriptional regulator [Candidatus Deferrimicrobium sp.]|nr:LuxR C-terminal-related transcriptional regulator [Candidatus Deferrimicrobium sp.]